VETRIERVEGPVLAPEVGLDLRRAAEVASAAGDKLTAVSSLILRALNGITSNPPPLSILRGFYACRPSYRPDAARAEGVASEDELHRHDHSRCRGYALAEILFPYPFV
jgi:hypothetical protein